MGSILKKNDWGNTGMILKKFLLGFVICVLETVWTPIDLRADFEPIFDGKDATRNKILVRLSNVASDLPMPTDVQFLPGDDLVMIVLEKNGNLKWVLPSTSKSGVILTLKVQTDGEQGLLGLAFHPRFKENRKIYINYNPIMDDGFKTRISEFKLPVNALEKLKAVEERVLLEVEQPFPNHKGGQLVFGSDGYLYIGLGDGGGSGDPFNNAQDPKSLLGKMLRIDVDSVGIAGKAYRIPKDNPFINNTKFLPEIWAYGLRNPWRFSFDLKNRLIAADVGQGKWEEISIIESGKNYGWSLKEGKHCFKAGEKECAAADLTDPVYEYGHDEGQCIIGGFVYTGHAIPQLFKKYVFGDFVAGRIWALDLDTWKVFTLGRWPTSISTFGRDSKGEIYLTDFWGGSIYRLDSLKN